MSATTIVPPESAGLTAPPPLENGDRLSREEFERRYEAMPHLKKAELLRGIVYMPSPVNHDRHGEPHSDLGTWVGTYKARTPGLSSGDNSTLRLGPEDEPQPDLLLMIRPSHGGQASLDEQGYITSAPELVVEVASSSVSYDLNVKLEVYRDYGVCEYVAWRVRGRAVDWFVLRGGQCHRLLPGPDGILRSEVFPGLWLDPAALIAGDAGRLLDVLQEGIDSPEHRAFCERLAAAG